MKLRLYLNVLLIGWSVHLLLYSGCASKQVKVTLHYKPTESGLLSNEKSSVVSLEVADKRPDEQRNNIGIQRNTVFGVENAVVVSKIPETQIVYKALRAELEKSGHRVLNPGKGHPDITLNVGLTEFLVDSKEMDAHIELVGSIRADVVASTDVGNGSQVSFIVEGSYRDFIQWGWARPTISLGLLGVLFSSTPKSHIEKVLDGTLAEFVGRFCLKPKLRNVFI